MTAAHGKDFGLTVDGRVLTGYIKTNTWEETPGVHDITGSGTDDMSYRGGQISRAMTIGGWLDEDDDEGPRMLRFIRGLTVAFERHPNGTGTGKSKITGNCVVGKYQETGKNDDIFQWTCDLQVTGAITEGTQS